MNRSCNLFFNVTKSSLQRNIRSNSFLSRERVLPIGTEADKRSSQYKENYESMQQVVSDLREKVQTITLGGNEKARSRHVSKGNIFLFISNS